LSRWLLEPKTGIFLGSPSARVRDELWKQAIQKSGKEGTVLQIWNDQNPQGFSFRQHGTKERIFVDVEGLALIQLKREITTTDNVVKCNENLDTEED
jgi:CRISPR-associated protein Cas2